MRYGRKLLWTAAALALAVTWLPYLGLFSGPGFVGPLPTPLAAMLIGNVVLTICVLATWPLCFKPLIRRLADRPVEGESA